MANLEINQLPTAGAITGLELVPIQQNGVTVQTTTAAISASPSQFQPFLTISQQPTLPNSRYLSAINGLQIADGGAQGPYTLSIVTNPTIPGNAGMAIPSGTSAQRNTTPAAIRFNTQTLAFEGFNGTNWGTFITNVAPPLVTFSAGTTGLTPNVPTGNNVVLAGTLNATSGGTGQSIYATGDLLYASSTTALSKLSVGTNGYILTLSSGLPTWQPAPLSGVSTFQTSLTGLTPSTATNGAITLAGTLGAASGGTGATTLTGYVYGNGVGAMTASVTIPNTAISGLGTMSTQNSTAVSITGGTINGTSIGATTRSTGDFTTISGNTVTSTTPVLGFNATNTIASFGTTTASSYNQLIIQNQSNSAGASTNYVVSNNIGTDSTYYGEFGMNSSTFSASTPTDFYSINNGIYYSGHDGDVSVGSGNGFKTYLTYGTTGQSSHVINASGAIGFTTNLGTTPALSGTTGFGTSGQPMLSGGSAAPPTYGTLGAGGGGTGLTASGTNGNVLTSNGTTWVSSAPAASGILVGKAIALSIIFGL